MNRSIDLHWNDEVSVVDRLLGQQRKVFVQTLLIKMKLFSNDSTWLLVFLRSM